MPKQVVLCFFYFSKVALTMKAVETNFTSPDLLLFFCICLGEGKGVNPMRGWRVSHRWQQD